ncbi:MAG: prepilin-type N-terminal cleavage/methylation domain-containing protein [Elusimicrobia bacterium]|nr:prepilin-type N-terminal cleavage/methylation domain-containing protein [Elusimicrobiota bacterium]
MDKMSSKAGYTLMELMIVVAIMGIVIISAPKMFTGAYRFISLATARAEIQKNSRGALANMNRDLRQAQASTIVVDCLAGQPPHSRITFTKYTATGATQSVSYYQKGKQLFMSQSGAAGKLAFDNLRYIAFAYPQTDDTNILSISVTFEKATYEGGTKALQLAVEKVRIMN